MGFLVKQFTLGGSYSLSLLISTFLGVLTAIRFNRCRLARFFYNASLILVATCVLGLGFGGAVSASTLHKGQTPHMDTHAKDKAKTTEDKVKAASLMELAPVIGDINRRYFKYYGQPSETVNGGFLERSQLTGNWNGGRDKLVEAGVYFDAATTQNFMGNTSGGIDTGSLQYTGSLDLWLNLDTAKLTNAFWPGATLFFHGESRWKTGVYEDSGAAVPPVFDDTMPSATEENTFYLSEYYLVQALSPKLSVWAGQMDGAGLIDGNAFANDEKHQFMNTALVDNAAIGPFAPYTATTVAGVYLPNETNVFIAGVMDPNGSVTESVFDSYHNWETVFVASYGWLPEFGGKPGRYQIVVAYTNKDYPDLSLGNHFRRDLAVGIDTDHEQSDNYISIGTFDQYLYVKDKARMVGWGLFGRYGVAPKDRNVIDQFYSFGIGGRGCLLPGRDTDFWGLGWAGTHLSSDLRDGLADVNIDVDSFEHVIEAFYNFALTPAIHLTLDAQYIINPVVAQVENDLGGDLESDSHAFIIGSRVQIDF